MYYVSVCVMCRHLTSPQTPSSQRWATHSRIKDSREETRGAMDPSRVTYRFGFIFPGEQHAWWCLVFSVASYISLGDCPTSHGRSWNPAKGRLKQHFHLQTALPMLSFIKSFQESCEDYFHPLYRITNSNTIHGLLLPTT